MLCGLPQAVTFQRRLQVGAVWSRRFRRPGWRRRFSESITTTISTRDLCAEDDLLARCYLWYHQQSDSTTDSRNLDWPLDFTLSLRRSLVHPDGIGVFVSSGAVEPYRLCMVYPGVIFEPGDPKLLFGLWNDFLLRRNDGRILDGKPRGLSGMAYRSLHFKYGDPIAGDQVSDLTWQRVEGERGQILGNLCHRLAREVVLINCGHYVNHRPRGENNVEYVEKVFAVEKFYLPLSNRRKCLLPYVQYDGTNMNSTCLIPGVVLIANKKIHAGEELTANYENVIPEIMT